MKKLFIVAMATLSLMACNTVKTPTAKQPVESNPLLTEQNTPYGVPAYDKIRLEHYRPAFKAAIAEYNAEIEAIVNNPADPTFENTIVALDRAGSRLRYVEGVFFNLLETDGNDEMNALAEEVTPLITECEDNVLLNEKLFRRVENIWQLRIRQATEEDQRLLDETHRRFVMNGAQLSEDKKARLREINKELGLLSLKFGQNVVAETNSCQRFVKDEAELKGLPQWAKDAAAEEAAAAGHKGEWLFTPKRTSFTPVLQYCANRQLRHDLLMDYTTRANHDNEHDNKAIINRTMRLRTEKAHLFGYACSADYILQDAMAHDGKSARDLLLKVWGPSLEAVAREREVLQKEMDKDLPGEKLQPWDWWYYAEKVRLQQYNLSEEEVKPYFEMSNVRKGVFALAEKLYGIRIEPVKGLPLYHPDVETFRVVDGDGSLLGIFLTDYYPRATKRPGAWMNNVRPQYVDADGHDVRPIIVNVGNFNKPSAGNPSLLSMDDVETLFHEFGHALHGLLSKCHYQSMSGTNTPRDFVELPSQFMENYCYDPEVMKTYAFHYKTGEVMPDQLIEKINAAAKFNQGFVETELLSASILDLDFHMLTDFDTIDVNAFEAKSLEAMGMIPEIIVRYRPTFYNHIFTTGYEAGYYSYTWSAVLDADAFAAFRETGNIFDPATAKRFRHLLEQGGTRDAQQLYREFRGHDADPVHLLRRKGFVK